MAWLDQRTAPGDLETLRAFVNTRDIAREREEFATPAHVSEWLAAHSLAEQPPVVSRADLRRAQTVREALRELLLAHTTKRPARDAIATLNDAVTRAKLSPQLTDGETPNFVSHATRFDAALGALLAIMFDALATGTWDRLKACQTCQWAFYDSSRNHRSRWCDMAVCGNRAKQLAYHERKGRMQSR